MKELKAKLLEGLEEIGYSIEENTSYFKILKDNKYVLGGRTYRQKIRVWIKTDLEKDIEKLELKLEPVYTELHKSFKWISFEIKNEEELKQLIDIIKNTEFLTQKEGE